MVTSGSIEGGRVGDGASIGALGAVGTFSSVGCIPRKTEWVLL